MKKIIMFLLSTVLLATPIFANTNTQRVEKESGKVGLASQNKDVNNSTRTQDEWDVFEGTIVIINDVIYLYRNDKVAQQPYIDFFMAICNEYYYNKLNKPFTVETVNEVLEPLGFQILSKIEKQFN